MKTLTLDLTALEPVIVTEGPAEGMAHESLGYIPGNMLIGAMAAIWKRAHPGEIPDDSCDFTRLFLNGEVCWGHAMPTFAGAFSVPVPLSFCRVKNMDDLPANDSPPNPASFGVIDKLALKDNQSPQECWQEYHRQYNPGSADETGVKIKRIAPGFMNPESLRRVLEKKVWNIHVALEKTRRAQDSQLFAYSAIAAGTRFTAHISCRTEEAAKSLEKLAAGIHSLWLGHARSAGYGHVALACKMADAAPEAMIRGKKFTIFLASQYLPNPSWAMPLKSLENEIASLAKKKPEIKKSFTASCEIRGFNGLWNRPRATRFGLAMGSVLEICFDSEVCLPASFTLGALRQEGYGQMLCNPSFLAGPIPKIGAPAKAAEAPAKSPAPKKSDPVWKLLRQRAARRLVMDQAEIWIHEEAWQKFLDTASKNERPGPSQRNNARDMTAAQFQAMLKKTPGKQWEAAVAYSPFDGRLDYLSHIMPNLLDQEKFLQRFPLGDFNLPGGPMSPGERAEYGKMAHALFMRLLLQAWGKKSTLAEKE